MSPIFKLSGIVICLGILLASEVEAAPVVANPIISQSVIFGSVPANLDVSGVFTDNYVSGTAVRLETVLGNIDLGLYDADRPITVTNFLNYINNGKRYDSSLIHRVVPNFVMQGGGFYLSQSDAKINPVSTFAAIPNEYDANGVHYSNTAGTISMAKVDGNPNSATSQWFINLVDNSTNLNASNGGFTVFGKVLGTSMQTVNLIGTTSTYNASSLFGNDFTDMPLIGTVGSSVLINNLVLVNSVHTVPKLSYTVTSTDSSLVNPTITGNTLTLNYATNKTGRATVTLTTKNLNNQTTNTSFQVDVNAPPYTHLINISTRALVQTGDNVLIGGLVIQGTSPRKVIVRAIGPNLSNYGVAGAMPDPTLELHDGTGAIIATNDNWQDSDASNITASGKAPANNLESAIIATLSPGNYTAIVRGKNSTTGVALVEVYELDSSYDTRLANISTRALVQTGDNVLIGGLIIDGTAAKKVIVRAVGPTLANYGVSGAMQDPVLELHDGTGAIIATNDNWQDSDSTNISATGKAPSDGRESSILTTLNPGSYTAIVRGKNGGTGVALVEVYDLDP